MEKISSTQAGAVLRHASAQLRKLASDNRRLNAELYALHKEARCRNISASLQAKGMNDALTFEEKVAQLMNMPESEVATIEKAVDLVAGDGVKLASVSSDMGASHGQTGAKLQEFLLTREPVY